MPPITRIGDDSTGHDACPPVPATSGDRMFTVSGSPVVRVEDSYAPHGCPSHPSHSGVLAAGAPHMSSGGKPVGRIGDPVSCGGSVAQGEGTFTVGDKGGERNNLEAFEYVREALLPHTDETERGILCVPEIAEYISVYWDMDENDKIGWLNLRWFLSKWLSSPACDDAESSPEVIWIDIDWILSYERVKRQLGPDKLWEKLTNNAARARLVEILQRDEKLGEEETPFDYTKPPRKPLPGNKPWRIWKEDYYQRIDVLASVMVDGLTASIGDFDFRALAAGYTKPLPGGGHRVIIERVSLFVWDSFNFHGAEDNLHYWSCEKKNFSYFPDIGYIHLTNGTFQDFRRKYNRGGDFMVLSEPRPVDWFGGFQYETAL